MTKMTSPAGVPIVRPAGIGRTLDVLGTPYLVRLSSAQTSGALCCIEHEVAPGSGVPPHTHAGEDEAFYVLSGTVTFEAGGAEPQRLGPGSLCYGPRGVRHTFRNETRTPARVLVFIMPGAGVEAMFGEFDALARKIGGIPSGEAIGAIAARYGVSIAAPERV
jgi:quercetin dioxygenase-like cupin family protein